jgi:hypothetical protein
VAVAEAKAVHPLFAAAARKRGRDKAASPAPLTKAASNASTSSASTVIVLDDTDDGRAPVPAPAPDGDAHAHVPDMFLTAEQRRARKERQALVALRESKAASMRLAAEMNASLGRTAMPATDFVGVLKVRSGPARPVLPAHPMPIEVLATWLHYSPSVNV